MNSITRSIANSFGGAVRAFETFPAAILSAIAFAIVTMIRIQLEWPQQELYNFLFNCLHWAFALGAVFSMTAITIAHSRFNKKNAFLIANLLGAAVTVITFLVLYFFGEAHTDISARYTMISTLAAVRVSAVILISFLLFIIIAGYPKEQSDFPRSFFMTHKALFIALIYGIVIMAGASGVAGAVQALLYHGMSGKVYMYIGTLTGFLAFTIFLGYFPDFRKGIIDDHREIAQKQPRFIEILLGYIIIPITLALTVVLLLWSGRVIFTGTWPIFTRLAGIATAYSFVGLWLHIMVTHHESGLAKFYRRVYPFAALIILAFEAGALFTQLGKYGLKVTEYWFLLVWIIAVIAAILLLILKAKAHQFIVVLICAVAVFSVFPSVGYHAMPVTAQVDRLERLLDSQGMLENNKLIPAASEPELSVRESITDAVYYLANAEDAKLPAWFDKNLNGRDTFETKLGFEPVWPKPDDGAVDYLGTSLYLKSDAVDVSDYKWGIILQGDSAKISGEKGVYTIEWNINPSDRVPSLKIKLDDRIILEQDMNSYIDQIIAKFPPGSHTGSTEASIKDMSLVLENEEVTALLIFHNININIDPQRDDINYWLDLNMIYLKEK
ncbi:DUF4153 domain-containing protein [Sinanaerobacter chloroacetimidivorans]|jgi:hypothetical protein|uniref:DUF4153 domain-containing protein n=1 Tax=Sinanaerobacter chloroacetimidivorans TaxID=2818044 RepID=A0A8J8B1X3_9FIRM|nr:DUF4153 domain-containing protein [Sinanaerobacter chloroacetimidivorans]MBR0596680.1 DUF4153 domain-containing protein [Sinanaerobacter chloroacetimidivorans]